MSKGKLLAVCCVWLVILAVAAAAWKLVIDPALHPPPAPWYEHEISFALDSFSGYAVFRSRDFRDRLRRKKIKLNLQDDGANYPQRIRTLRSGDVQMAVFTVDALVKASAEIGELPAVIVAFVDETRGADAMLAYRKAVPNVDALNHADVRFVLTPDSPSETLTRVVIAHFNLENLAEDPFVRASDAEDVYRRYREAKPETPQVFVLWEPYVSKVLQNPNTHVVVDSADFEGYIVDVIVANRDYFLKNEDVVVGFVEAYLQALDANIDGMVRLVFEDAKALGTPLTPMQAENLVKGVWWKNTQENLAHMGLHPTETLQHIDEVIGNITNVLLDTEGIETDPTGGKPDLLYYNRVLSKLARLHPDQQIRKPKIEYTRLTDGQVQKMLQMGAMGTMAVRRLVFARGSAKLTAQSYIILDELTRKLRTWPQYYLVVRGNASQAGELEEALALARAEAAKQYLLQNGINENRVYAVGGEPTGTTSVSFVLGQPPR